MVINNRTDIRWLIRKARKDFIKRNEGEPKPKVDRLIKLYNIIKVNAPLKNRYIDLSEWGYPMFYLEVVNIPGKTMKCEYPDNIRMALSYNVRTGTIMDETIDGRKSDMFHGCIRKGFYKVLKVIKKQLETDFSIPIKT